MRYQSSEFPWKIQRKIDCHLQIPFHIFCCQILSTYECETIHSRHLDDDCYVLYVLLKLKKKVWYLSCLVLLFRILFSSTICMKYFCKVLFWENNMYILVKMYTILLDILKFEWMVRQKKSNIINFRKNKISKKQYNFVFNKCNKLLLTEIIIYFDNYLLKNFLALISCRLLLMKVFVILLLHAYLIN